MVRLWPPFLHKTFPIFIKTYGLQTPENKSVLLQLLFLLFTTLLSKSSVRVFVINQEYSYSGWSPVVIQPLNHLGPKKWIFLKVVGGCVCVLLSFQFPFSMTRMPRFLLHCLVFCERKASIVYPLAWEIKRKQCLFKVCLLLMSDSL